MDVLIAYAGKSGTTKRAANLLASRFPRVDVIDLCERTPDPSRYAVVIVGSAIRIGRVMKPAADFLVNNWEVLQKKTLGVFICNAYLEQSEKILQENFSVEFRQTCAAVDTFGGELHPENCRGFDNIFAKAYLNYVRRGRDSSVQPVLLTDRIRVFADRIKEAAEAREA